MRWIPATLALTTLAACGDIASVTNRSTTDVWQQSPTDQVDLLFVVDNSNSMALEQDLLAAGFDSFIEEIENTGVDFHLGIITTDFVYDNSTRGMLVGSPAFITADDANYADLFRERVRVGLNGSGKEKGLEAAAYALSPTMTTGPNAGFLRQEANLLIVFVSDEDDCSDDGRLGVNAENTDCYAKRDLLTPVSEYVSSFQKLKPSADRVQLASIVGPEDVTGLCDDNTLPGTRYIEAARLTAGLSGSICDTDWSNFLYDLGLNAAGIYTVFELAHGAQPGTLEVTVDGDVVPESPIDGYTYSYSEGKALIEFHGIWIPERGAEIAATYDIEPGT